MLLLVVVMWGFLQVFSQYPGEAEYLIPPLSCLEVQSMGLGITKI